MRISPGADSMYNDKEPPTLYFIHFYISYALFSLPEGFFVILPIYIKSLGGNEFTVGKILFFGTFGSVISILAANYTLRLLRAEFLCCLASLFYALACIIIYTASTVSLPIYGCGLLLGAGTGIFVGVSPLIIHPYISDSKRNFHYSFMSGLGILGMGISPLIAFRLLTEGQTYKSLMLTVFSLCILTLIGFFSLKYYKSSQEITSSESIISNRLFKLSILREKNIFLSLIISFLFGCIFSAMINFQSTYAIQQNLQYQYFYVFFISSIMLVRFLLGNIITKHNVVKTTSFLFIFLFMSVCMFPFIKDSNLFYACSASLLGLSYGLVFPLIQSNTINRTPVFYRAQMLILFSFSYFISTYSFPYFAGWIIVNYGYIPFFTILAFIVVLQSTLAYLSFNVHSVNLNKGASND